MKYPQLHDGDWIRVPFRGFRAICCDCGLTHVFNFKLVGRELRMQVKRHARATAAARRKKK